MPDATESSRIRAERKAQGLCTRCGVAKARKKKAMCQACVDRLTINARHHRLANLDAYAQAAREKRATLKAQGICTECTVIDAMPDRTKCEGCLARAAERVLRAKKP